MSSTLDIREERLDQELQEWFRLGFRENFLDCKEHDGGIYSFVLSLYDGDVRVGAIAARTFWKSLHIQHLYIVPGARDEGIGSSLMETAIAKGKHLGCQFAFVETLSFQAVDFYKSLGFIEEFTRSGYALGISCHYLRLDFT